MNYANSDCVVETRSTQAGRLPSGTPAETPTPPPLPEQLSYVADQLCETMDLSDNASCFLLGRGIAFEKRENDSVTAKLMWICRNLHILNETLREIIASMR